MNPVTPIPRLRADSASAAVLAFLQIPHAGQVVATFERSFYLDLDHRIIAVVSPDLHNGPLNLVVSPAPRFDRLAVGTSVHSSAASVEVTDEWEIVCDGAASWDPVVTRIERAASSHLPDHVHVLTTLIAAEAPTGGLGRVSVGRAGVVLTPLERFAFPALTDLCDGLRQADAVHLARGARALAGLGPGLTPAGDDILVGCLLALAVLPDADEMPLVDAIAMSARHRTTRISEAYLEAAARGEASELWHRLVAALGGSDSMRVTDAARQVLAVGETSGSDMLGGFVLATRALAKQTPAPVDLVHSTEF